MVWDVLAFKGCAHKGTVSAGHKSADAMLRDPLHFS